MLDKEEIRNWIIYKITSPSGRVYIGKSCNAKSRFNNYKNLHCKHQTILYKSLMKYGYLNHATEIIENFDGIISLANSKEIFWIGFYMSNYSRYPKQRGMNLTDGGDGNVGVNVSKETRKKQSLAKRGKPAHNKGKKGQVAWNKGKRGGVSWNKGKDYSYLSEDERKDKFGKHNIGNSYNKGRKQKPEFVEARIKRQIGKPLVNKYKPILQFSLDGVFLKEHESLQKACADTGIDSSTIRRIANGLTKKPKAYFFKYKNQNKNNFNSYIFQRKIFKQQEIKVA